MDCGDLTSPLTTVAACNPNLKLNIHINDINLSTIARSILILKIALGDNFEATNPEDLNYLWDICYNATWPEATLKRFVDDVISLMEDPLSVNILIPESNHTDKVKKLCSAWLTLIDQLAVEEVLASR